MAQIVGENVVEIGPRAAIFEAPSHPYTQALLNSVPSAAKGRKSFFTIAGDVPSAAKPPSGCRFHTRCPIAREICSTTPPPPVELSPGHRAACHFAAPFNATPNHATAVV